MGNSIISDDQFQQDSIMSQKPVDKRFSLVKETADIFVVRSTEEDEMDEEGNIEIEFITPLYEVAPITTVFVNNIEDFTQKTNSLKLSNNITTAEAQGVTVCPLPSE